MLEFDCKEKELSLFNGNNYDSMLTAAHGNQKKFFGYIKAWVDLAEFGAPDVISWFVFMNGQAHGYPDGWLWTNKISDDKKEIIEENVSTSLSELVVKRIEEGFHPFRLAFQRASFAPNSCKFVGAYRFDCFLDVGISLVRYVKVADSIDIPGRGVSERDFLDFREAFSVKDWSEYHVPIEEMELSSRTKQILKKCGLNVAGDLLRLGFEPYGAMSYEILVALHKVFRKK